MSHSASYVLPFARGALIGLSASLVYLLHGRIAGIAGLFGGTFLPAINGKSGCRRSRSTWNRAQEKP